MLESGLLKRDSSIAVAVSGGIDSMALLHFLCSLRSFGYSCAVKAVHINHGTRAEQKEEEDLVRRYCAVLGVEFYSSSLEGLDVHRNFEHEARKARYKAMRSLLKPGDLLALGHHIDDSFEWSILQSFRSSSLEGSLGIPVRNKNVIRPFMSVTKAHIRRYVEVYDLPFLEDPTNESLRHERNYIRKQVSEGFAARYPKYLKHYVYRQNELARRLGKHISLKSACDFSIIPRDNSVEIFSYESDFNPSGLEYKIVQGMRHLVPEGRGSLSGQIEKIIQAMKNNKAGPLSLAGGVKAYLSHNHLLLARPGHQSFDAAEARKLALPGNRFLFKSFTYEEYRKLIKSLLESKVAEGAWPCWVEIKKKNFNMEGSKSHQLWPELFAAAKKERSGELMPAIKLLRYWARPKNKNKRLVLRFLFPL